MDEMVSNTMPVIHEVFPLLHVRGGAAAIDFYKRVFGAQELRRLARRAVEAGATMVMEPADQGHGERQCRIRDPFGHEWLLGHGTESVSLEEIQRRFEAEFKPA